MIQRIATAHAKIIPLTNTKNMRGFRNILFTEHRNIIIRYLYIEQYCIYYIFLVITCITHSFY